MAEITTIDDYISAQPEHVQPILQAVRTAIAGAVPEAVESISYKIAAFKYKGRVLLYFAGWKGHYSLYPITDRVREAFGDALSGYKFSKGTMKLSFDKPVPVDLIARLALFQADEIRKAVK